MSERKPCRCLLGESSPDLAAVVADYVAAFPEGQRTSAMALQRRLALCLECAQLRDGTCALCGCYVEARAAKARMTCPAVPRRWGPEGEDD